MKITFDQTEKDGIFTSTIEGDLTEMGIKIGEKVELTKNAGSDKLYTNEEKNSAISKMIKQFYIRMHLEYSHKNKKPE